MKSIFLFCLFIVPFCGIKSQVRFMRTYGDIGNEGGHFIPTFDKGYVGFCYKDYNAPNPNTDMLLIKTDSTGDTLWTRIFQGNNGCSGPWDFCQLADSGFLLTGTVIDSSFSQPLQSVVIRTDKNGDTLWTIGGVGSGTAFPTSDGGFAVYSAFNLTKFNQNRTFQWKKTYLNSGTGSGRAFQTTDGGYLLYGETSTYSVGGPTDNDVYIVKTDSFGIVQWAKAYGGTSPEYSGMIQQTFAGDYVVASSTQSFGAGSDDVLLMKLDANGDTLWVRTMGGSFNERIGSVQQTYGVLGYVVTGTTPGLSPDDTTNWGNEHAFMLKVDYNGGFLWGMKYGIGPNDHGGRVYRTYDNGFIYSGFTGSWGQGLTDAWLIKTDALGDDGCYAHSTSPTVTSPTVTISQGSFSFASSTVVPYYVPVKTIYSTQVTSFTVCTNIPSGISVNSAVTDELKIFPVPTQDYLYVDAGQKRIGMEIRVFNFVGQLISSKKINQPVVPIDLSSFSAGIYLIVIWDGMKNSSRAKFIKQ